MEIFKYADIEIKIIRDLKNNLKKTRDFQNKIENFSAYGTENAEIIKEVFERLEDIIEYFGLEIKKINSDIEANAVLSEVISISFFYSKFNDDIEKVSEEKLMSLYSSSFDFFDYFNINEHMFNNCKKKELYPAMKFLLSNALIDLINNKNCFKFSKDKYKCEKDTFSRILCPSCFQKFKHCFVYSEISGNRKERYEKLYCKSFCPECTSNVKNYLQTVDEKPFCSVCLENRILKSYNSLRLYMQNFDLISIRNYYKRIDEYKKLLEKVVSIIYYEKEQLPDGYGYFKKVYEKKKTKC